jgi:hypothetical protein
MDEVGRRREQPPRATPGVVADVVGGSGSAGKISTRASSYLPFNWAVLVGLKTG